MVMTYIYMQLKAAAQKPIKEHQTHLNKYKKPDKEKTSPARKSSSTDVR